MNKTIDPYDLGNFNLEEYLPQADINDLVEKVNKDLKQILLKSEVDSLGFNIKFTTSRTRFGGKRIWFVCPACNKRVGKVYQHPSGGKIGCRNCLNLKYRKQKYKGMIEEQASNITRVQRDS